MHWSRTTASSACTGASTTSASRRSSCRRPRALADLVADGPDLAGGVVGAAVRPGAGRARCAGRRAVHRPDRGAGTMTGLALTGACVVVTGAGSGIGAALARRFAGGGAHVVVNDLEPGCSAGGCGRDRRPGPPGRHLRSGAGPRRWSTRRSRPTAPSTCSARTPGWRSAAPRSAPGCRLGTGLARERAVPRARRPRAAARLAGAGPRAPDHHRLGGRHPDHARLGAVLGDKACGAGLLGMVARHLLPPRDRGAEPVPAGCPHAPVRRHRRPG